MASKIADSPRPIKARPKPPAKPSSVKAAPAPKVTEKPQDKVSLTRGIQEKPATETAQLTRGLTDNFAAPAKPATEAAAPSVQSDDPGQKSVDLARKFEGMLSQDVAGKLGEFGDAGRKTNNCADFVSSVLKESNRGIERTEDVSALRKQLLEKGWQEVPRDQAKPGDVWMTTSDKHGSRHTELITTPGGTHAIGSNNIPAKESQQKIFERENSGGIIYGQRPAQAE